MKGERRQHAGFLYARGSRTAFRRGFRQRNPLVLVAAAALTALFLFLLQVAVTSGAFTAISQSRYDRIHNDDYVHITYELGQLKRHPPKGATIYLFGGSEAMESIVSQTSLARAVAKAGGGQTAVISLAGHQQTLAQTLAIIDNLPRGNALLLVGLAPSRFTTSPAQDVGLLSGKPFIAPSPRLAQLAPQLYGKSASLDGILPGIFDYMISYASQRASLSLPWAPLCPMRTTTILPAPTPPLPQPSAAPSPRSWPPTRATTPRTRGTNSRCSGRSCCSARNAASLWRSTTSLSTSLSAAPTGAA